MPVIIDLTLGKGTLIIKCPDNEVTFEHTMSWEIKGAGWSKGDKLEIDFKDKDKYDTNRKIKGPFKSKKNEQNSSRGKYKTKNTGTEADDVIETDIADVYPVPDGEVWKYNIEWKHDGQTEILDPQVRIRR